MDSSRRTMLLTGLFLLLLFGGGAILFYLEPEGIKTRVRDYEAQKEIMVPLGVAAMDIDRAIYLLPAGERPSDEEFANLEQELEAAITALKRWRELEKK